MTKKEQEEKIAENVIENADDILKDLGLDPNQKKKKKPIEEENKVNLRYFKN